MSATKHGLVFDSPTEANRFAYSCKSDLYKTGWVWTGRCWFLKETRKPGKTLLIEFPNWKDAYEWEMKMAAGAAGESNPQGPA